MWFSIESAVLISGLRFYSSGKFKRNLVAAGTH